MARYIQAHKNCPQDNKLLHTKLRELALERGARMMPTQSLKTAHLTAATFAMFTNAFLLQEIVSWRFKVEAAKKLA